MTIRYSPIIDKIRDLYHEPDAVIPLHAPVFNGNEKNYLNECVESTFVSSVGKFVDQFEIDIAKYTGVLKAVACVNGTNALHIALKLLGVERDSEVITQALTFIATANAISYCGAKPVFIDVDLDTMGLSPQALNNFLQTETYQKSDGCYNKKTHRKITACVPMHTFGHPCRIDEIVKICTQYNLPVVEDAAESLGSFFKEQHTGTFGKIGVLSFNGNKLLTTGGGGMLLFNNPELAEHAKHLTTQAKVPHRWKFIHNEIGYNYRMPNINAAIGVAQLEQIDSFLIAKRKLAQEYKVFLEKQEIQFFTEPKHATSNYWLNVIILRNKKEQEEFLEYTNNNGLMTRPVWELINKLTMFNDCQHDDLTNTEWLADRIVNIPSSVIL